MTYLPEQDNLHLDPKVLARIVEILNGLPKEFYDHDYSKRTIAVAIKRLTEEFANVEHDSNS